MFNPFEDTLPTYLDDFHRHRSYSEKRDYVEKEMVKLAKEGKLYLTGLMILGQYQRDIVGDIIFGREINDGQQQSGIPLEQELESYKVSLTTHEPKKNSDISWKDGRKRDRSVILRNSFVKARNKKITLDKPVFVTKPVGQFTLQQAYKALKQNGCWVKHQDEKRFKNNSVLEELPKGMKAVK